MEVTSQMTYEEIERNYINRWKFNARQHFDDGDYGWLCDFIKRHIRDNIGIAEIGCGAGYSTLSFAQNGFNIAAIDTNSEALKETLKLLQENEFQGSIVTAQLDAVHEMNSIVGFLSGYIFPISTIVLCNPGGNLNAELSQAEFRLLRMFGFKKDELIQRVLCKETHLLHKWSLIYAACSLAIMMDKMLIIVDRGSKEELELTLDLIQYNAGIRKIASELRIIRKEPENGIPLGKTDSEQYWGAALYNPLEQENR